MIIFNEDVVKSILRFKYSLINFENTKKVVIIFLSFFDLYFWPETNYLLQI